MQTHTCCHNLHVHVSICVYVVASVAPFPPIITEVITTPYSVNISWVVPSIIFDQENYTVWYGTDMTMLQSTSELVQGSSNRSVVNGLFSTNITGLSPFTRYYYVIMAVSSVGSNSTRVMDFTTDETGTSCSYCVFNAMYCPHVQLPALLLLASRLLPHHLTVLHSNGLH